MRECGSSDAHWFPIEFLVYYDDHNKLKAFAYVKKQTVTMCLTANTTL